MNHLSPGSPSEPGYRWLWRYRGLAIVTTGGVVFLTVAGGVVRLTDSGLGCEDWPACNEQRFIDVSSTHSAIEQVNRLASGLIGIPTLLLLVVGFLVRSRPGLRWPAVSTFTAVVANGVVGGLAVRGDLHPALVQAHFLLAMIAVTFGLVAVMRAGEQPLQRNPKGGLVPRLAVSVATLTAAALTTGTVVTGTGPHAGDEMATRFGFEIANVARIHSVTVLLTLAVALWMAQHLIRSSVYQPLTDTLSAWLFVGFLQGALGYSQYLSGVPELLVAIHITGAVVLWILTIRLLVLALTPPQPSVNRIEMGDVPAGNSRTKRGVTVPDSAHV